MATLELFGYQVAQASLLWSGQDKGGTTTLNRAASWSIQEHHFLLKCSEVPNFTKIGDKHGRTLSKSG